MTKTTILLHPRTGLPIVPLGYGRRGPIWPILGGADDDPPKTDPPATDPPRPEPPKGEPADPPPSDKGFSQADVDRVVEERIARERKKYADYADLKAKATEHDKFVESQRSEQEKAVDAARKEGAQSVLVAANARLVASEARALAAEANFRSPGLVVKALDLSQVAVSEDGDVDADAIKAALEALAAAEPYLVDDGGPRIPKPDPSQGSGKAPAPTGAEKGLAEAQRRFGTPITP